MELRDRVVSLMLNFKPNDSLIKKRVEALIEREYLDRDKTDSTVIIYKA